MRGLLKVVSTVLLTLLLFATGCGEGTVDQPVGQASSGAKASTTPTAQPSSCPNRVDFQAFNSGVVGRSLESLATRLKTTAPQDDEPEVGQAVSMTSDLSDGGTVTYFAGRRGAAWQLESVAVCPGGPYGTTCGDSIKRGSIEFRLAPEEPGVSYGVGRPLGTAWALGCSAAPVGPVGVYAASERAHTDALTVTWNGDVHMYIR